MKILIVQTAFIGDVVLTFPMIEAIKQSAENCKLHFLTLPQYENFVSKSSSVSKVLVFDKKNEGFFKLLKFSRFLKNQKYDLAILPHRSFRSGLLVFLARVKKRVGFDIAEGRFFYTDRVPYIRNIHEVERNLTLARFCGFEKWDGRWNLPYDESFFKENVSPKRPQIVVSPLSNWATKMWPLEYWIELINKISRNFQVIIVGGGRMVDLWNKVKSQIPNNVLDFVGKTDFLTLSGIVKNADLLITNDSAPLHFASAFNVKSIVIFGPTVPAFGFGPYNKNCIILEKNLPCRPCNIHGPQKCPLKHHNCMRKIYPQEVFEAVNSVL